MVLDVYVWVHLFFCLLLSPITPWFNSLLTLPYLVTPLAYCSSLCSSLKHFLIWSKHSLTLSDGCLIVMVTGCVLNFHGFLSVQSETFQCQLVQWHASEASCPADSHTFLFPRFITLPRFLQEWTAAYFPACEQHHVPYLQTPIQ